MKRILPCAAAAALLMTGGAAQAGTSTTQFNVTVAITAQCSVGNATNMAFPSTGVISAAVVQTSTFDVTCSNTTPYDIGLDSGLNASGTQRRMKGGATDSEFVNYNLFSDAARTVAWASTSGSLVSGAGNGAGQTLTVYGQIPAQTTPSPGTNYTDTVTIAVTF